MQHVLEQRTITPELAVELLEQNISNNRNVKKSAVDKYHADMLAGNWKLSDALKFDKAGNLIDGQHRLHAVVKYNRPVEFLVVKNYDSNAAQVLDIGAKRTVSDIAKLQHKTFTSRTGTVLRYMVKSGKDMSAQSKEVVVTEQQLIDLYDILQPEVDYAFELRQNNKVGKSLVIAVFARAAYHYNVVKKPETKEAKRLSDAKRILITGVTDEINNPLIPMRDHVMTTRILGRETVYNSMKVCDYALSLFMTGEGRKRILLPKDYQLSHEVDIIDDFFN